MTASSDRAWLAEVAGRYEAPLLRYAARITTDLESARDVVQDTFLRLCRERRDAVESHLAPWLFTVCRRRAIDVRRKEGRMKPTPDTALDRVANPDPGPAARTERRDAAGRVLRLLARIPAKQQEVIRLKFQNGLSYREISEITGLSTSHVGVLIHHGMRTLRAEMRAATRLAPGS